MVEEGSKLSAKNRISGNWFYTLANAQNIYIRLPEYLWHWSRDSQIITFFVLELSQSLR